MNSKPLFENLYQDEVYLLPSRTLVLLSKEWTELSNEEMALLTKILHSVKLAPDAVQILTGAQFSEDVIRVSNPGRIISFGVALDVPSTYQVSTTGNAQVIVADPIDQLNDARKKNLWVALRQMFGI
jgi:hypothetical protein